jgi:hypothetical protein
MSSDEKAGNGSFKRRLSVTPPARARSMNMPCFCQHHKHTCHVQTPQHVEFPSFPQGFQQDASSDKLRLKRCSSLTPPNSGDARGFSFHQSISSHERNASVHQLPRQRGHRRAPARPSHPQLRHWHDGDIVARLLADMRAQPFASLDPAWTRNECPAAPGAKRAMSRPTNSSQLQTQAFSCWRFRTNRMVRPCLVAVTTKRAGGRGFNEELRGGGGCNLQG